MTRKAKLYCGIAIIFIGSAIATWLSGHNDYLQTLYAIPMVASVLGALFQVLRDEAAHDRQQILQNSQNTFVLGAGSHMAQVAFGKHVEFAESYMQEALSALATLFRHGPTPEVLRHAAALHSIREKFLVWLTASFEAGLDPFESALREIGADAGYVRDMQGSREEGAERQKAIERMHNRLAQVMGLKQWKDEPISDELAITNLSRKLRLILGTEELTKIRGWILNGALRP